MTKTRLNSYPTAIMPDRRTAAVLALALAVSGGAADAGLIASAHYDHQNGLLESDGTHLFLYSAYSWSPSLRNNGYDRLEIYDPGTGAWQTKATAPASAAYGGSAVLNGVYYTIAGEPWQGSIRNSVYAYDTATDQWSQRAAYPKAVFGNSAAVLDGKIYGLGGQTGWNTPTPITNGLYEYDPTTNLWTTKAPLPYAVAQADVLTYAGKLYIFGGYEAAGSGVRLTQQVQIYDPLLNQWSAGAALPAAAAPAMAGYGFLAAVAAGGRAYLFSQPVFSNGVHDLLGDMFVYDFAHDSWITRSLDDALPLNDIDLSSGAALIGNSVYFVGASSGAEDRLADPSRIYALELVPVPATPLLLVTGFYGLAMVRRRRH